MRIRTRCTSFFRLIELRMPFSPAMASGDRAEEGFPRVVRQPPGSTNGGERGFCGVAHQLAYLGGPYSPGGGDRSSAGDSPVVVVHFGEHEGLIPTECLGRVFGVVGVARQFVNTKDTAPAHQRCRSST